VLKNLFAAPKPTAAGLQERAAALGLKPPAK
jgi:hypothetical protein